jgi:hypothetical protein
VIGYRWFVSNECFWRKHHGAVIPLSMPHALSGMNETSARSIINAHGGYFIRWESAFDQRKDGPWWHIIKSESEDLRSLSGNTRSKIRRASKRYITRLAPRSEIIETGYRVYFAAYSRYKTFEPVMEESDFRAAVSELPDETEFWIVETVQSGEMVAFSENLVRDGACFYLTMWYNPESLRQYASYLLIHEMNRHYLNHEGLLYVSDGARNISHQTGIHDFLVSKFHFRRAYANLHVVYAKWLLPVVYLLYPFRRVIDKIALPSAQKITVLLEQESIRRDCLRSGAKLG